MTRINWTHEKTQMLRELVASGLSYSQIGRQMGVTKNVVIGRAHRMNIRPPSFKQPSADGAVFQPKPIKSKPRGPRRLFGVLVSSPEMKTPPTPLDVLIPPHGADAPVSLHLSLADLGPRQCHYPYGDPLTPELHFCGHPTNGVKNYCEYHHKRCYQPIITESGQG